MDLNKQQKMRKFSDPRFPSIAEQSIIAQSQPGAKVQGGGGQVPEDAQSKLLQSLKTPMHFYSSNEKLLHNKKVYDYYLEGNSTNKDGLYEKIL